jgi:hypothetical protein
MMGFVGREDLWDMRSYLISSMHWIGMTQFRCRMGMYVLYMNILGLHGYVRNTVQQMDIYIHAHYNRIWVVVTQ